MRGRALRGWSPEVGLDHVGIVLGIEMSRLARTGRDWHQLLELCALSGALLADLDGVYDPAEHNDRLLLGLKGTMSEAELHLIRQRMWSGRLAKARRGELAVPLPAGLRAPPLRRGRPGPGRAGRRRGPPGLRPVRAAGHAGRRAAVPGGQPHPAGSAAAGRARARGAGVAPPEPGGAENMLRNPAYAGIYAYGRSTLDPRRRQPGRPCTGRVARSARDSGWSACPGCCRPISASSSTSGTWRDWTPTGPAPRAWARCATARRCWPGWCACGRCGSKMTVRYQRGRGGKLHPVYVCSRDKADYGAGQCQQLAGPVRRRPRHRPAAGRAGTRPRWRSPWPRPGRSEAQREPGRPDLAAAAGTRRLRQADRARRQYQLAEPENRLVARQLEKDWEAALAERQRLGEEYDRFTAARPRTLTAAERARSGPWPPTSRDLGRAHHHRRRPQAADPRTWSSRSASRSPGPARRSTSRSPGRAGTAPPRRSPARWPA